MTIRVGYLGKTSAPEFAALRTRANITLAVLCDPEQDRTEQVAGETGAAPYDSPDALVAGADIDAVIIGLPAPRQAGLTVQAAERGVHTLIVPPLARGYDEGKQALETVERCGIITSVGWPMRYAINLVQIRHHVRRGGAQWVLGRLVTGAATGEELLSRAAGVCDLVRYVAGPVSGVEHSSCSDGGSFHGRLRLDSGAVAHVLATSGAKVPAAEEASIEVLTAGNRMAWYYGTNHTVVNGTEQRVAEKPDGLYVAEIAAFLTSIETGWRSPILCDYADGVETLAMIAALRQALEEAR